MNCCINIKGFWFIVQNEDKKSAVVTAQMACGYQHPSSFSERIQLHLFDVLQFQYGRGQTEGFFFSWSAIPFQLLGSKSPAVYLTYANLSDMLDSPSHSAVERNSSSQTPKTVSRSVQNFQFCIYLHVSSLAQTQAFCHFWKQTSRNTSLLGTSRNAVSC